MKNNQIQFPDFTLTEICVVLYMFLFLFQFCEWMSTSVMCQWAGPIIDLLLEHVGHIQLCSKLTELLDSREEWLAVKRKSCKHLTKSYLPDMQMSISLPHATQMCISLPHATQMWPNMLRTILFISSPFLVHSVTSSTDAPLQIQDSDTNRETQTEISPKSTSARQTDQIPKSG